MNKNYIAPQIESMDVEPEEMMVDSKAMNAVIDGNTPIGKGYGGVDNVGLDADSRFFDDFWDDDDEY